MRRIAAKLASARRAFLPLEAAACLAIWGLLTAPAVAGDLAELNVFGYSADAAYFAFEEFGVHDGSGAPYSSIYIVDLKKDAWVGGSPFRIPPDNEDAKLDAVRQDARKLAQAHLDAFGTNQPASILAVIGDGVPDSQGKLLSVGQPRYSEPGAVGDPIHLSLATFPTDSPKPCEYILPGKATGFSLTVSGSDLAREVHRDTRLPQARGCAMDYRLYAVLVPFETKDMAKAVALVSVYTQGFEGPDRRFIAVPLGL